MWLSMVTKRLSLVVATLLFVGVAGCAARPDSMTATTTPGSDSTTNTAPSSTDVASTTSSTPTATLTTETPYVAVTTTTAGPAGEPIELWVPVPGEGAILGVVGVRHDDMLNVRSGPDVSFDVIAALEPTQTGIAATGEGWQLPSGLVWWRINTGGVVGWANQQFLSRLGSVDDVTSFVIDELGQIPVAETMLDLGLIVANAFADVDSGSNIVVSVAPTVSDLGEVTYDVTGLGDDSLGGYRLHVFGQPTDRGFSLMAIEATTMCQRGVSSGLCV